jgi:asparagine synthase (glutamine-hydrolysing)
MSAIGGVLTFNGGSLDWDALTLLTQSLASRGPDGGDIVVNEAVGMCYRSFHTNRESAEEAQPLRSVSGNILVYDGRLDNSDELMPQLDECRGTASQNTDAVLTLAAYSKWGPECFPKLIGDFAFAIWDESLKTLFLVRDHAGTRPLFFHKHSDLFIFSSTLSSLLALSSVNLNVDEEFVAGHLTRGPEVGHTPYRDIHTVKPAHAVAVRQDGRLWETRFWRLDPTKEIRYKSDSEYQEHALSELTNAVRCRLRSNRPIFAELSGGLDSSTIVCLADRLISSDEVQASQLETISQVFDECPSADERRFIREIEGQRTKAGHHLSEDKYRLLASLPDDLDIVSPNPILISFSYHKAMCDAMHKFGARVLLSGLGGDELLGANYSAYPELADLLVSRKPVQLHHRTLIWSRALKQPYLQLLWKSALLPTLPRGLQVVCKRSISRELPPWYKPAFVKRMNMRERRLGTPDPYGFLLPSGRDQAIGYLSAVRGASLACRQEMGNVEVSYPFLHRPLVEFVQAIPLTQLSRPGENRVLMRRALKGILPDRIAQRRTKGNPNEAIFRAVAREWPRLRLMLNDARVCAYGYMDQEPLSVALNRARYGCEPHSAALIQTISLEFWLRALAGRRKAAENRTVVPERSTHSTPGRFAVGPA